MERSTYNKHHFEISVHRVLLSTSFPPSEPEEKKQKDPARDIQLRFICSSVLFSLSQIAVKRVKLVRRGGCVQQREEILKCDAGDLGIGSCSPAKRAFLLFVW